MSQTDIDRVEVLQYNDSWKTSAPRQITLNIGVEKFLARKLQGLGLDYFVKDADATLANNNATMADGKVAGVEMRGRYHKDAVGLQIADNGIGVNLSPKDGTLVSLARLRDEMDELWGFDLTGIWLVKKENRGDVKFHLKIRFDGFRQKEQNFTNVFLWHYNEGIQYYKNCPEENFSPEESAKFDTRELREIIEAVMLRQHEFLWFYKNPNRSWTLNVGGTKPYNREKFTAIHLNGELTTVTARVETLAIETPKIPNTRHPQRRVKDI